MKAPVDSLAALEARGHVMIENALSEEALLRIDAAVDALRLSAAGARDVLSHAWCRELARALARDTRIAACLPASALAVQCGLFAKTASCNWLVALHQDMHIPVAAKIDHPSLSGWSCKQGRYYVQAPVAVLEPLVAVRVHLDDCSLANGPLRVVEGSHRFGVLHRAGVDAQRQLRAEWPCAARRGTAHLMKPLLLHASSKASVPTRRRVLHFLYAAGPLPLGLLRIT
jgi:ectoine hydroxylase-related dioxygenase (phytanoyl-CoA dioxygenase family)